MRPNYSKDKFFYIDLKSLVLSNLIFPSGPLVATLKRVGLLETGVGVFGGVLSSPRSFFRDNVTAASATPAGESAISFTSRLVSTSLSRDALVCSKIVTGP
jgi:hypothetical protein